MYTQIHSSRMVELYTIVIEHILGMRYIIRNHKEMCFVYFVHKSRPATLSRRVKRPRGHLYIEPHLFISLIIKGIPKCLLKF